MSGFEALRHLRAWPETAHIPVIALSAAAMPRDTKRGEQAGFVRYLTKPVKVDQLTELLESLLLNAAPSEPPKIECHGAVTRQRRRKACVIRSVPGPFLAFSLVVPLLTGALVPWSIDNAGLFTLPSSWPLRSSSWRWVSARGASSHCDRVHPGIARSLASLRAARRHRAARVACAHVRNGSIGARIPDDRRAPWSPCAAGVCLARAARRLMPAGDAGRGDPTRPAIR